MAHLTSNKTCQNLSVNHKSPLQASPQGTRPSCTHKTLNMARMLWTMCSIYKIKITLKYKIFDLTAMFAMFSLPLGRSILLSSNKKLLWKTAAFAVCGVEVMLMWSSAYWQFHQWVVPLEVWARCRGSTFGSKMRTHHRCCWKPFIPPSTMLWNFQTLGDLAIFFGEMTWGFVTLGISMVLGWWWSLMKSANLGDNRLIQLFNSTCFSDRQVAYLSLKRYGILFNG